MIDAYYSRGCDSTELFEDTRLATVADYKKHMNKYNVIHLMLLRFGILTRTILLKRLPSIYIKIYATMERCQAMVTEYFWWELITMRMVRVVRSIHV